jgi:hypothetical protein
MYCQQCTFWTMYRWTYGLRLFRTWPVNHIFPVWQLTSSEVYSIDLFSLSMQLWYFWWDCYHLHSCSMGAYSTSQVNDTRQWKGSGWWCQLFTIPQLFFDCVVAKDFVWCLILIASCSSVILWSLVYWSWRMICIIRGTAGGAYCMDGLNAVTEYSMQGIKDSQSQLTDRCIFLMEKWG